MMDLTRPRLSFFAPRKTGAFFREAKEDDHRTRSGHVLHEMAACPCQPETSQAPCAIVEHGTLRVPCRTGTVRSTLSQNRARSFRTAHGLTVWALLALLLPVLLPPTAAFGAGSEVTRRDSDLTVTLDSRWAGTAYGGYYPLRIRALNAGPTRAFTFRFDPFSAGMPTVERQLEIEQNATVQFSLSIPVVSSEVNGAFRVMEDGSELKSITSNVSLPEAAGEEVPRTSLLVITPDNADCTKFEEAANSLTVGTAGMSSRYGYSYTSRSEDHAVIPPVMLPESWLDYSGLDNVAIPLATLEKIPVAARTALLDWVECGGTLLIYKVGQSAGESVELTRVLPASRFAANTAWKQADATQRTVITIVNPDAILHTMPAEVEAEADSEETSPAPAPAGATFVWRGDAEAFQSRDLQLGRVFAFPDNPFPGSAHDWAWWLGSVGDNRWKWPQRHGLAARDGTRDFFNFPIPGVGAVPVLAFLILITGFTIVIGPLNYAWLWRRKQLYLLVLTIPVIAFVTSASLFIYAALADGFGVKSRVQSLTVLNQNNNTAVAMGRLALYAGMAPSSGLTFSANTAMYPIWRSGANFESGRLDWTNNNQHLTQGWLRSRTLTQFATVSHRDERGRLEIRPGPQPDRLSVSNGLAWKVAALYVIDDKSQIFSGSDLPAGAATELVRIERTKAREEIGRIFEVHRMVPPTGFQGDPVVNWRYRGRPEINFDYQTSLMMRQMAALRELDAATLGKQTYIAILAENPGIELGVGRTTGYSDFHVLVGRY